MGLWESSLTYIMKSTTQIVKCCIQIWYPWGYLWSLNSQKMTRNPTEIVAELGTHAAAIREILHFLSSHYVFLKQKTCAAIIIPFINKTGSPNDIHIQRSYL